MSSKYSAPAGIKSPYICHKVPPAPPPSHLPREILYCVWQYRLTYEDWSYKENHGSTLLLKINDSEWSSDATDETPGRPLIRFTTLYADEVGQVEFVINFSPGSGIDMASPAKTLALSPPFHYYNYLFPIMEYPEWMSTFADADITEL